MSTTPIHGTIGFSIMDMSAALRQCLAACRRLRHLSSLEIPVICDPEIEPLDSALGDKWVELATGTALNEQARGLKSSCAPFM